MENIKFYQTTMRLLLRFDLLVFLENIIISYLVPEALRNQQTALKCYQPLIIIQVHCTANVVLCGMAPPRQSQIRKCKRLRFPVPHVIMHLFKNVVDRILFQYT